MWLDAGVRVGEKVLQGIFYGSQERVSGSIALAKPRRIKAAHRRRRKVASGQSVQRYYDPQIGRFLSVDPVTALDGGQQHFNRYAYAYNNPYRFTDPDGRCPMCAGFVIGAGIDIAVQVASNMAQGQDFGDAVSNINGTQVLISGALGSVGQLGGSTAARTVVSGLSNGAKGRLGEGVARVGIALRGEKVLASQTAAGKVGELGQLGARAAKAVPDFVVRGRDGAVKVVEAKFNTAGLTGAQRALRSEIGSAFTVSRTTVGEVANAGGVAGAVAGGSAGAAAGEIRKRADR
ncbi:MAG: RHS repeat-associated core domain-containing protein [Stenotrophomonas sp.]